MPKIFLELIAIETDKTTVTAVGYRQLIDSFKNVTAVPDTTV